jgi:chemotaxis protein MotB
MPILAWLAAIAILPIGCAEMQALRERTVDQDDQLRALKEENKQFQDAYYQIKETMEGELARSSQRAELLQRDLEQARNLRTQKENELSNQLRTRTLDLEASRNEMEELKKLNEATIARLERDKQSLTAERDAALDKLALNETLLRQETERGDDLTRQVAGLKVDLEAANDKLTGVQKELTTTKEAVKTAQESLATTKKTLETTQQKAAKLEGDLAEAAKANAGLKERTAALTKKADAATTDARKRADLTKTNEGLRKELEALKARGTSPADDAELVKARDAFAARVKQAAETSPLAKLEARLDATGLRLLIPSDALFRRNAIVLSDEGPAILDAVAGVLGELPARQVRVEGHTDNQPIEELPFADNWGLGFARADRVREYLSGKGGVQSDRLTALTRAQYQPLSDNQTAEGRARNRRVEIVIGARQP